MAHNNNGLIEKKLEDLKRVANQSASMHSVEADRYNLWGEVLTSSALLSTAFLLLLSLASDDFINRTIGLSSDSFKWVVALFSFLTFSSTLISLSWRPFYHASLHRGAIFHFSRVKHEIDILLRSRKKLSEPIMQQMKDKYLGTDQLPKIADRRFNKLKQRHLQKDAISKELSVNPYQSLRIIRKTLVTTAAKQLLSTQNNAAEH